MKEGKLFMILLSEKQIITVSHWFCFVLNNRECTKSQQEPEQQPGWAIEVLVGVLN